MRPHKTENQLKYVNDSLRCISKSFILIQNALNQMLVNQKFKLYLINIIFAVTRNAAYIVHRGEYKQKCYTQSYEVF